MELSRRIDYESVKQVSSVVAASVVRYTMSSIMKIFIIERCKISKVCAWVTTNDIPVLSFLI